ncbi:hypothetical protein EDD18DRAFT_1159473 [Armillaria luteobubalina]|uniref:Uncharacterized protein n=1 Tax=Armillaria luteobubalina TaxID=153913 RepID=A0AA39Q8P0_9AGAR|nr:hypothetical protein EDD18DRAFT_1159473 [Armillaria luteobubalina]
MVFVTPHTPMDHLLRGSHRMQQSGRVLSVLHSTIKYTEFKENVNIYERCRGLRADLEKLIDATFLSGKLSPTVNRLAILFHSTSKTLLENMKLESEAAQLADKFRVANVSSVRIVSTKVLLGPAYRDFVDRDKALIHELRKICEMKSKEPPPERVPVRRFAPSTDNEGRSISIVSSDVDSEVPTSLEATANNLAERSSTANAEDGASSLNGPERGKHITKLDDLARSNHRDDSDDPEPMTAKKRSKMQDPSRFSIIANYSGSNESLSMSPEQLVAQRQTHGVRGATRHVMPAQDSPLDQKMPWEVVAGLLGLRLLNEENEDWARLRSANWEAS